MSQKPLPVRDRKVSTGFSLSPAAIRILDSVRGKLSRSAYIEKLIREA